MPGGFLLDTSVFFELRKGERADPGVREWFDQHADAELWLSVLVAGELRQGCESLRRRDEQAGTALLAWLDAVATGYADRILPVTAEVAERWALLDVPDPLPLVDGLLVATAIEHDLVLVTRNVRDLERTGVPVENPFTGLAEASGSGDTEETEEHAPRFVADGTGDLSTEAPHRRVVETPAGPGRGVPQRSRRPRPGTRGRRPA